MIGSRAVSPAEVRRGEYWQLVLGPMLLLVVLFARGGIDGLLARRAPWLTRCSRSTA